jgi:hypothetical protein
MLYSMRRAALRRDESTEQRHERLNREWRERATGRTLIQLPKPQRRKPRKRQLQLF